MSTLKRCWIRFHVIKISILFRYVSVVNVSVRDVSLLNNFILQSSENKICRHMEFGRQNYEFRLCVSSFCWTNYSLQSWEANYDFNCIHLLSRNEKRSKSMHVLFTATDTIKPSINAEPELITGCRNTAFVDIQNSSFWNVQLGIRTRPL